jgi:cell division protein FtsL
MRTGIKVLIACLAAFGFLMLFLFLVGILQWLLIAVAVLAIGYGIVRLLTRSRRTQSIGSDDLHTELKRLETDISSLGALGLEKPSHKTFRR